MMMKMIKMIKTGRTRFIRQSAASIHSLNFSIRYSLKRLSMIKPYSMKCSGSVKGSMHLSSLKWLIGHAIRKKAKWNIVLKIRQIIHEEKKL